VTPCARALQLAVFVTGASSGIGLSIAKAFAAAGAKVAVSGRNEGVLDALAAELGGVSCPADIADAAAVDAAVAKAVGALGKLDVLVNNAGVLQGGAADDTSVECWDLNFSVNARGSFLFMRAALPHLIAAKGNVVNVSSVNGIQSFAGCMAYCASKAAVDHMTRCAAVDLAPKGVRVNSVNPGVVVTELQKRGGMGEEAYEAFLEHSKTTHPIGRVAQPEECAQLVLFLADNAKAGMITGSSVKIDGGRACMGAR
jgi:NAD(P)-dependent dehydrogenase (short-subunit alcohol dehydrogenase family)